MAQIILSAAGQAVGSAVLPQGLGALGVSISGAAIGGALGGLAGRVIDGAVFGRTREGPRLESLRLMESREGAGIANVYGRMRIGGQVIWAARLKETRSTASAGGKGGPRVSTYAYSASFAVGLCEGEIARVDRVWANGETVALADLPHRLYRGSETQLPDPLIEAIEGAGCAPAYRGLAYIVFEDLPLDRFGNRLPQLSFEVYRTAPEADETASLAALLGGVNLIPASGEFVYGTVPVAERLFPARESTQNAHNGSGVTDLVLSLDQMEADLPAVSRVALTVGWFGTDLRAGQCEIRPGVDRETKDTVPYDWRASDVNRANAWQISRNQDGGPNYGGTPADRCVVEGIRELAARGMEVTVSPFLFMDVPPGNGLADPYGGAEQAAFPWRGRITANDGTAAARTEIEAFLGAAEAGDFSLDGDEIRYHGPSGDWGFRRFILHHAWLAKLAGGVGAFLVGSEMRGLTRIRDEAGAFPFVEGLIALAGDVRTILGPGTRISYAADWTEYGAYVPGDGSGDVLFPLDAFWADGHVDFVGVDSYPPVGDWRNGTDHLDALAGFAGPDDPAYLAAQMQGGEAYDWFYASQADRDGQVRTPIIDTAHGEHWVFRQKDLAGWWAAAHHARPGGVRAAASTGWVPGSKPVRLSEIGFPAVDKGGNAPNLFFDPKSAESALPPYSNGTRDDVFQARALAAALGFWQAQAFIEAAHVWAWDARPWPLFPVREDIWSDGANWAFGHWLNGRAGLSGLGRVIEDIGRRGGVEIDAQAVSGVIEGFALSGVSSVREALASLFVTYGLDMIEREAGLVVQHTGGGTIREIAAADFAGDGPARTRRLLDKRPGRLRLSYVSGTGGYEPANVEARDPSGDRGVVIDLALPVLLTESQADRIAERLLGAASDGEEAMAGLALSGLAVEPGDRVREAGTGRVWQVADLVDAGTLGVQLVADRAGEPPVRATDPPEASPPGDRPAAPQVIVMDAPPLPGMQAATGPLVAVYGTPWARPVDVLAGPDAATMSLRAEAVDPAGVGRLVQALAPGPLGRWDEAAILDIDMPGEVLPSFSETAVLGGAGLMLVQAHQGWELLSYQVAELTGAGRYRLRRLLRGLQGSLATGAEAGAACVRVDERLVRAALSVDEQGLDLVWQASGRGGAGDAVAATWRDEAGLAFAPAHLVRAGDAVRWVRRAAEIGDAWRDEAWPNGGRYRAELLRGGSVLAGAVVEEPAWTLPAAWQDGDTLAVREIGRDGRLGHPARLVL